MSVRVQRVPGEPILIGMLNDLVTEESIQELQQLYAEEGEKIEGTVYIVADTRGARTTFSDVVQILSLITRGEPGSLSHPRYPGVLVGATQNVQLVSESLRQPQYGSLDVPVFATLEEAMGYVRERIAQGG